MERSFDTPTAPEYVHKEQRKWRVQHDLQQAVEHDKDGAVLTIPPCERVPDHNHRDAARKPDHDHASAVRREVWKCSPCQCEHDEWRNDPVEQEREEDVCKHVPGREKRGERLVADFSEDGPHHDDEPNCNSLFIFVGVRGVLTAV